MEKDVAEKIAEAVKQIDDAMQRIHLANDQIEDVETRKRIRRAIGGIILDVHEKITCEVTKKYPDPFPHKRKLP
jgi:chaperonin cofactor prefoldin